MADSSMPTKIENIQKTHNAKSSEGVPLIEIPGILDRLPKDKLNIVIPKLWLIRNPDWSTWRYLLKARLFECVALSCEVSPHNAREYLEYFKECHEICREEGRECGEVCEEEEELPIALCTFRDRLKVAIANVSSNGPLKPISEYPEGEAINAEIYLADFADFAESVNWVLPNEFPRKSPIRNTDPDLKVSGETASRGNDDDAALGAETRRRYADMGKRRHAEAEANHEWWTPFIKEGRALVAKGQSKQNAAAIVAQLHPEMKIKPGTLRQKL